MATVSIGAPLDDNHSLEQFSHLLSKEEIKSFSRLDNLRFLAAVLLEMATIALAVWVSETFWNPFVYLLAIVIIGSRMGALTILMHDAAHYRAFTNRKWNDFIGEAISLALPTSMQGYRNNHFAHHHNLNTDQDPDWVRWVKSGTPEYIYPKTKSEIALLLCQYALGLKTFKELKALREKQFNDISLHLKVIRFVFQVALIGLSIALGFWKPLILYWLIPSMTSYVFFLYIITLCEHYTNLEYQHVLNHSRTVVAPFWERWLFAPYNINYHIEHHLYPSVPFYRLAKLHRYLMTNPTFAQSAHITYGFTTGLFRESCKAS